MRLSHFFIDRPIFAAVVSVVFVIVGVVSVGRLPVAQVSGNRAAGGEGQRPVSRGERGRGRRHRGCSA